MEDVAAAGVSGVASIDVESILVICGHCWKESYLIVAGSNLDPDPSPHDSHEPENELVIK